jgi:thiamine-monophosphate kinase
VPRGRAVLRSGAKPGDSIYVTGELGGSALALQRLIDRPGSKLSPRANQRHFFPEPRVALGMLLRRRRFATAMIDISDGLSTDLAHICEESRVGARLYAEALPRAPGTPLELALNGGDDYELLFTAAPRARLPAQLLGVRISRIGEITRRKGTVLVQHREQRPLVPRGWQHFSHQPVR